ncbi:MAG: 30S ribosomal protein S4 [Crocinitomicaceae bacterium]|jgi:small subunit ribosomal protein S4|nr:30S ribosomal protein S4 [Lentimicrobiaceae bacterium]MDG1902087.1 30S ribosomal protein S4 [Bacteroidales bacterium]MDG2080476.1 30S ribosomal protein S4 [Bacteroidales bacterium]MDG2464018.1 30S ribosomal protein S4 [Crocinitomicaceae bacterium]|tara:strand:- start:133 stop:738 length:606 start_codon:yes stop_codon:yes gene_type:complete
MARYTGPKSKIARKFNDPIYGPDKFLEKKAFPPGQHGTNKRRKKQSEYGIQLQEKQKAKYTYGILERQFRNVFKLATRKKGITGENLLKLIEARLDNTVFRLGISPTRSGARQLVSHRHITVNGSIVNIPSYSLKEGDIIGVREKSKSLIAITDSLEQPHKSFSWLEWDSDKFQGKFLNYPPREEIPENIKEQLIVELYSK